MDSYMGAPDSLGWKRRGVWRGTTIYQRINNTDNINTYIFKVMQRTFSIPLATSIINGTNQVLQDKYIQRIAVDHCVRARLTVWAGTGR